MRIARSTQLPNAFRLSGRLKTTSAAVAITLGLFVSGASTHGARAEAVQAATNSSGAGTPFTADKLAALLPPSVYFQGRTASLQLRNAAGMSFPGGQIVWMSLVDTSGYSTSVQERYQFYLVTEGPLTIGGKELPAGAYGGGFQPDGFVLMDIGGHTLAQGPLQTDPDLRRPRPLQLVADRSGGARLYLGRRWILLQAGTLSQR